MRTFNAIAAVVDALKHHPETHTLPESLQDAEPIVLAEARNRLAEIAQVATELRRLVDGQLADALAGSAFRYGDSIMRPTNGKGDNYVKDGGAWFDLVIKGLQASPRPQDLLASLFPLDVKVTGIPMLAAALGEDADRLRADHIANKDTKAALEVKPVHESPKFLQNLEDGEIRQVSNRRVDVPVDV